MPWTQSYDPLGNPVLSTLAAALPLVGLLGLLATHRVRAHVAALVALGAALAVAVLVAVTITVAGEARLDLHRHPVTSTQIHRHHL